MKLPPLLRLAMEALTWRKLLLNRFTLVVLIVALVAVPMQVYASSNDNGVIQGRVVDESGNPVPNASVTIQKIPLEGVVKENTTTTNQNGRFKFTGETDVLDFRIVVKKEGVGTANNHYQSLFPGQDRSFEIVLDEG